MDESTRPSMKSVQRTLIVGVLVGLILGCALGAGLVGLYIQRNPPVYEGGAYPGELTNAYQNHYLAMAIDSYIVNQEIDVARERLKTFNQRTKIQILGERSAAYVAAGRGVEAQLINNLAVSLKGAENWNENTIKAVVGDLTTRYQSDPARSQAINTFSAQLLEGQVPVVQATEPAPAATEAPAQAGGFPWLSALLYCLGFIVIALIVLLLIGRLRSQRAPARPKIEWEGEGAPPLKQWSGTYTLGQDNYDEFFTIETDEGDFLGESGVGILEALPGTSPKQVVAFDVGLFDKTDITTLSRVVMSEHAYNDETIRAKVEANPQAEAVLAEPGKEFTFETTAIRVEAKIEELEYGEGSNVYFSKLKMHLNVFLKEGADVKRGEMEVPEEFRS